MISNNRLKQACGYKPQKRNREMLKPEDIVGDEWAEWYQLDPSTRWKETEKLWSFFIQTGGSLDPEPDTQSPFYDAGLSSQMPADGRSGVRIIRRSRV